MRKRPRVPKPILPILASVTGPALIKHLASCNTTVRSQSLRLLQSWLTSQPQDLSDSDMKKLWKGLFYCLWHSDKTPNQVALIDKLTLIFSSLQPSLDLEFFRGFLVTLRREWPGIDRLRLDKFYLLIRRFMKALFELMRLRKWDVGVLGEYFGVLERDGFLAEDKLQGNGVNYHIASVFLEELKEVGFPVRKEVIDAILGPFFSVLLRSKDKVFLGKVKSCLFDELLKAGKQILENIKMRKDCNEKDGDVLLGAVGLKMSLAKRFYEVGSSEDCVQGNRKVCLGFHEEFLKLEKELESSGIEFDLPEYSDTGYGGDDGDSDVPQLIPIHDNTSSGNMEFSSVEGAEDKCEDNGQTENGRVKKKTKKVKKGVDVDDEKAEKKKKKKKKRKDSNSVSEMNSVISENGNMVTDSGMDNLIPSADLGTSLSNDFEAVGDDTELSETVISNLQKQFEKVAAEAGSYNDEDLDTPNTRSVMRSKRKRGKGVDRLESSHLDSNGAEVDASAKSVDKSAKRVRFAMKNNLVWKPQNPLPPESLRLPPTVTPRGSALKKGVPPGPIIETPPAKKRVKQRKKAQKRVISATPVMKKRKKMLTQSV